MESRRRVRLTTPDCTLDSPASANPEIQTPGPTTGQQGQVAQGALPALPETEEEFRRFVAQALDLEGGEEEAEAAEKVSQAIWARLQCWKWREECEKQDLESLFEDAGHTPLQSYADLQQRRHLVDAYLSLDEDFLELINEATTNVLEAMRFWMKARPQIRFRRWEEKRGAEAPAKPPANPSDPGSSPSSEVA